jgi:hypothetical protein
MCQNLTSGEFKNQHEIFISSCNTGSETSFQAGIHAITGMSLGRIASGMAQASLSTDPGLTFSLQAKKRAPGRPFRSTAFNEDDYLPEPCEPTNSG